MIWTAALLPILVLPIYSGEGPAKTLFIYSFIHLKFEFKQDEKWKTCSLLSLFFFFTFQRITVIMSHIVVSIYIILLTQSNDMCSHN